MTKVIVIRDHTQWHTHTHAHTHTDIFGRTPLDEGSAHRRELCLIIHNIYKRQTSMLPAGIEPAMPASEQLLTYAVHSAATGNGEELDLILDWDTEYSTNEFVRDFYDRSTYKLMLYCAVEFSWNVMAHGDARVGKWRGNWRNGEGSQYSSHYLGTWCVQHYYRWCAHLGCQ
jgi:hypothetical protein